MKVWVAESWEAYEGSCVLGVASSPFLAMCICMDNDRGCGKDWCEGWDWLKTWWLDHDGASDSHGYTVTGYEVE